MENSEALFIVTTVHHLFKSFIYVVLEVLSIAARIVVYQRVKRVLNLSLPDVGVHSQNSIRKKREKTRVSVTTVSVHRQKLLTMCG